MKTHVGSRILYDNFHAGTAIDPNDPSAIYLVFTDNDNEETHMFLMSNEMMKKYEDMIRESRGPGLIIANATEMPNGGRSA